MAGSESTAAGHYLVEQVSARTTDLTSHMNRRWDEGLRLEHITSVSWGAVFASSPTLLVLVWVARER